MMKTIASHLQRRSLLLAASSLVLSAQPAQAVPSWGARSSSPADTAPEALKAGEWIWLAAEQGGGPLLMLVSLTEQRAYLYRNAVRVAISTVSSGKPGHETPTGVFSILQKDRNHHSNKYDNAPMPFQQRLTWDGVALHAGGLPGYPESHGCVHLPTEFARRLFEITHLGMTVVVAREGVSPASTVHPGLLAPVATGGESASAPAVLAPDEAFRWTEPPAVDQGPPALVLSLRDQRMLVLYEGREIARARISVREPLDAIGTHAYVMGEGSTPGDFPGYPNGRAPLWFGIGWPGRENEAGRALDANAIRKVSLPPDFLTKLVPLLRPGTVLVLTDEPILPHTTGGQRRIIDALPPA